MSCHRLLSSANTQKNTLIQTNELSGLRPLCDISCSCHLNKIIYFEHTLAQLLVKACSGTTNSALFWMVLWRCNWSQVSSFFLFLLWICVSLTGQSLPKPGRHSLLCRGEGLQWDPGLLLKFFSFYLNGSWHLEKWIGGDKYKAFRVKHLF